MGGFREWELTCIRKSLKEHGDAKAAGKKGAGAESSDEHQQQQQQQQQQQKQKQQQQQHQQLEPVAQVAQEQKRPVGWKWRRTSTWPTKATTTITPTITPTDHNNSNNNNNNNRPKLRSKVSWAADATPEIPLEQADAATSPKCNILPASRHRGHHQQLVVVVAVARLLLRLQQRQQHPVSSVTPEQLIGLSIPRPSCMEHKLNQTNSQRQVV
ncbi:unnamed protein product [Polarella glacialis]|uniref:Uncharacterized protein n=1 Tax=Polarella glacialis TaxID=89957 RepID=A0A813EK61_POLGL|nr:unnamed protein product [Polarella glacialis]